MRLIRACGPVLVALALVGCGGGADVATSPFAGSSTTANATAPTVTIGGTPATSTTVGSLYSFTPTASDSDGGKLTFSVQNAPAWASFNTATGQLSGSPKATDTGSTFNIVISAADGVAQASLAAFSITVTSTAATATTGSATVSWAAPTQNSDGSPLANLAGYRIYYGNDSGALNQSVQVSGAAATSYVFSALASGTWYFAVSSYTTGGTESARSAVVSKTIS